MKVKEYVITSEEYHKAIKNEKIANDTIKHVTELFSQIGHMIITNPKELEHALIHGFEKVYVRRDTSLSSEGDIIIQFQFKKE